MDLVWSTENSIGAPSRAEGENRRGPPHGAAPCRLCRGGCRSLWAGRLFGCGEEFAEPVADLAALGLAVFPLVGVNLEGGVGFAVSEAALDVDEAVVEGDQHAGVAVPEVVQGRVGCRELGGFDGAAERPADHSAFEPCLVAGGEE